MTSVGPVGSVVGGVVVGGVVVGSVVVGAVGSVAGAPTAVGAGAGVSSSSSEFCAIR